MDFLDRKIEDTEFYTFIPSFIPPKEAYEIEKKLDKEVRPILPTNGLRNSCKFSSLEKISFLHASTDKIIAYGAIKDVEWKKSETVVYLKAKLEEKLCPNVFDYCLFHHYTTGKAAIAPHRDGEALNSVIASLSFGQARDFLILPYGETKLSKALRRITLESGDLVVMKVGCQENRWHCIPAEPRITKSRYNLTFRQLDDQNNSSKDIEGASTSSFP